eukprot:TRINITY_DN26188_c0_g6_i1.p1 TRINITY_DN26188_c0_g6~~TRINITY_DN26188_c0_g6_i1.p1  ORF type:complete len:2649 (+),score=321.37 TRINITY_DN26188_c0_g6_i1:44-7948(+)
MKLFMFSFNFMLSSIGVAHAANLLSFRSVGNDPGGYHATSSVAHLQGRLRFANARATPPRHGSWRDDKFSLCPASPQPRARNMSHRDGALVQTEGSCGASEVLLTEERRSGVTQSCCPKEQLFCSGCAKMNSAKSACSKCSGGFVKVNGICTACLDTGGWLDTQGRPCLETSCSDKKVKGLSSKQACCKCGGGQLKATPWDYVVEPLTFGASTVLGFPSPRTAERYSVEKDCELMKYGLTIDGKTGKLELASGCTRVGCGATKPEPFSVACVVTAHQSHDLESRARILVTGNVIGYERNVLIVGATTFDARGPSASSWSRACVPSTVDDWLTIRASDGRLVVAKDKVVANTGLTGTESLAGTGGGVCTVSATTAGSQKVSATVMVFVPSMWPSMSYGTSSIFATIGEFSATLKPQPGAMGRLDPTRFSAACDPDYLFPFTFDILTGIGSLDGHPAFALDVKTGSLRVEPARSMSLTFDKMDTNLKRRKVILQCKIYGHYEWLPDSRGSIVSASLNVEVRDDTCWTSTRASFRNEWHKAEANSISKCRALCRKTKRCTQFRWTGNRCYIMDHLCAPGSTHCGIKNEQVDEKIENCGELSSCIRVNHPDHWYLSGMFCPIGNNGAAGPVYKKVGATVQDTYYLAGYDPSRDGAVSGCNAGSWVVKKPHMTLDFADEEASYVELHGSTIVCLSRGSNVLNEVFINGKQSLTSSGGLQTRSVTAEVAGMPCGAPNTTHSKDDEDEQEESVEESVSSPLVLDDPTTEQPADHWLHPCECFPESWGPQPPVADESMADIPAGSGNEYAPAGYDVVAGEFVCEQTALLPGSRGMHVATEGEAQDSASCETLCRKDGQCRFYWDGEVKSTKQCRLYSRCTILVREVGVSGKLTALPDPNQRFCRIANPDMCWKATKRRNLLQADSGAAQGKFMCSWEPLALQCDHKLLLGGLGVEKCGRCLYADVQSHTWKQKEPVPKHFEHGRSLIATCWSERFTPVPVDAGHMHDEDLKCVSGKWIGRQGHLGLSGFACGACIQLVRKSYRTLFEQQKQELYFVRLKEVQILVDTKVKMQVNKDGNLVPTTITPWNIVGSFRLRPLSDDGKCVKVYHNNLYLRPCDDGNNQKFFWDGEQLKNIHTGHSHCMDGYKLRHHDSLHMRSCTGHKNQAFYWDGNLIRSRGASDMCFNKLFHGNVGDFRVMRCNNHESQQFYQEDFMPLKYAASLLLETNASISGRATHVDFIDQSQVGDDALLPADALEDDTSANESAKRALTQSGQTVGSSNYIERAGAESSVSLAEHVQNSGLGRDAAEHKRSVRRRRVTSRFKMEQDLNKCADAQCLSNQCNLYMHPCHNGNNQKWRWDGERIRSAGHSNLCVDMSHGKNLVVHACHNGNNQKFFWDGTSRRLKIRQNHECIDWNPGNQNLYIHGCHSGTNQKVYFEVQDCVADTSSWGHCSKPCAGGTQSRTVTVRAPPRGGGNACPASSQQCNTHSCPVHCQGHWQPWGSCSKTCGGGTQRRTYVVARHPRHGGNNCPHGHGHQESRACRTQICPGIGQGGFVPEMLPQVAQELKRFRSTEVNDRCLQGDTSNSFFATACAERRSQVMHAASLSTLLWEKFETASAHLVPGDAVQRVHGRRRRSTKVYANDMRLNMNCGDHVVNQYSFDANGHLGMKSGCTAAATVGSPLSFSASCHGGDEWKTLYNGNCLAADFSGTNVKGYTCSRKKNQRWYWEGERLRVESHPGKCLDMSSDKNIYMHPCRSGSNQKFYIDEVDRLRIRRDGNLCLDFKPSDGNVYMHACHRGHNQMWVIATGIKRFARAPMQCPDATVLSFISKSADQFAYKCSLVADMGACKPGQSPQVDASEESLHSLKSLGAFCDASHALQNILPESSDAGEWIRIRFSCCALGGVPTAIIPTSHLMAYYVHDWEGVYAPARRDDSGRLVFEQRSAFKFGAGMTREFKFNKETGKWCVGTDCAASGIGHPLDEALSGSAWTAMVVADFDGEFEGAGVTKAPKSGAAKKPPQLIKFGATQPEYAEECKDDVTPGSKSFDAERMYEVSMGLSPENPCSAVGGKIEDDGNGDGTFWQENALDGNKQQDAGDTYTNIIGCANREIARNLQMGKWAKASGIAGTVTDKVFAIWGQICDMIPDVETAPMGFGLEWSPENTCNAIQTVAQVISDTTRESIDIKRDYDYTIADNEDCNSQQLGLQRIFCDLHCIRDTVKAGDSAILKSLTEAVETIGKNTQLLVEHYTGVMTDKFDDLSDQVKEVAKPKLLQVKSMRDSIGNMLTEMRASVATRPLGSSSLASVARAISQFSLSLKHRDVIRSNSTMLEKMEDMHERTSVLHATIQHESQNVVPLANSAAQQTAQYAHKMNALFLSQTQMLGVYTQSSIEAKYAQRELRSRWEARASDVVQELQDEAMQSMLLELDESWWSVRSSMDRYLTSAQEQATAFQGALGALEGYTSACSLGFSQLQRFYSRAVEAEKDAHAALRETWGSVVPLVGLMVSKLVDGDGFGRLARTDAAHAYARKVEGKATEWQRSFCGGKDEHGEDAMLAIMIEASDGGLFGQTARQSKTVFDELLMLADRYTFGGLGTPPDVQMVRQAWSRLEEAYKRTAEQQPAMAAEFLRHFRQTRCATDTHV